MTDSVEDTQTVDPPEKEKAAAKAKGKSAPVAKGKAKAKAKVKAKAMPKGKAKAKAVIKAKGKPGAKAKSDEKPSEEEAEEEEQQEGDDAMETDEVKPAPKAKAKAKAAANKILIDTIGDRKVEDVIAESQKEIEKLEALIKTCEEEDVVMNTSLDSRDTEIHDASVHTEAMLKAEAAILQSIKQISTESAQQSVTDTGATTTDFWADKANLMTEVAILEEELDAKNKLKPLEQDRIDAQAAAEAAKKALEESKTKEKDAQEALKNLQVEQKTKEGDFLKECMAKMPTVSPKDKILETKMAQKDAEKKFKAIEKERELREKNRQQRIQEASGRAQKSRSTKPADEPEKSPEPVANADVD